ncbi:hypothetical protein JM47_00265 [Ureaplasma diversum]|uniref:5'-nucleotidase, lipoprotein e(P4) family n=1 Tax=Ureaplasma diversum TaxID=42094 RepID=A0A0C5RL08_9BACT|nr:HAD family acid phosphatase [Ureaplasma diversum]AJQ45102.1 hypothetical protein JM47_00265 [Ureaplasma diversum]
MRKHKRIALATGLVAGLLATVSVVAVACNNENKKGTTPSTGVQTQTQVAQNSNLSQTEKDKYEVAGAAWFSSLWNTTSAEKRAMSKNAYETAKASFDKLLEAQKDVFDKDKVTYTPAANGKASTLKVQNTNGKAIPVVFMDIDETILNNYAYQNYVLINKLSYNPKTWNEFVKAEISTELDGAIDFIKHVYSKGGVVMFNSNREQETEKQATINNLVKVKLDEALLPEWVFWMQGVDLGATDKKPWNHIKKDEKGKRVKSNKEDRMNFVNDNKLDLTKEGQDFGNAVQFKTIMRVGDNFDDFNDNATKRKGLEERNKVLDDTLKLFGNSDANVKGVRYEIKEDGSVIKKEQSWSESYVMIGGNASYGGFIDALHKNIYKMKDSEKLELFRTLLKSKLWWEPKAK